MLRSVFEGATASALRVFVLCTVILAQITAPLFASCGANARQSTLRTTMLTADTARDEFVKWDATHQLAIIEEATSRADAEAKLDTYRKQRENVVQGFTLVYRAIALATMRDDDDASLKQAALSIEALLRAITALKGGS